MPTYIKELPSKEWLESVFYEKDGFILWKPKKISRGRDSERAHRKINTHKNKQGHWIAVIHREWNLLS